MSFLAFGRWAAQLAVRLQKTAKKTDLTEVPAECLRAPDPGLTLALACVVGPLACLINDPKHTAAPQTPEWLEGTLRNPPKALSELMIQVRAECASTMFAQCIKGLRDHHGSERPGVYVLEHLLTALDPKSRIQANMYGTPTTVARWMASRAFENLDENERKSAVVIDPAMGSGVLLLAAIEQGLADPASVFGIDSHPAAHAAATALLSTFAGFDRAQLILTDALLSDISQLFSQTVNRPVVIIANPPFVADPVARRYVAPSTLESLSYRPVGTEVFSKNPKWLGSLSLQFLQWIQAECHAAQQNGKSSVLAIAINRAIVEQPTFASVRRSLLYTFNTIDILDLHGAARAGLKTPTGERDQNIFEIQQGICILVGKRSEGVSSVPTSIARADLWGTRKLKLSALQSDKVDFVAIKPSAEPKVDNAWRVSSAQTEALAHRWDAGFSLRDAYAILCPAPITGRDGLVVCSTREQAEERLALLRDRAVSDAELRRLFLRHNDRVDFPKVRSAATAGEIVVTPWAYRAFDERFVLEHPLLIHRPRDPLVLDALRSRKTLAMVTRRQSPAERQWNYLLIVDKPACDGVLRADPHGTEVIVPREVMRDGALRSNAQGLWLSQLAKICQVSDPREASFATDAFAYCVGVLSDPEYQRLMQRELCADLPRISWPTSVEDFREQVTLGQALIAAHTQDTKPKERAEVRFECSAESAQIEYVKWLPAQQRVQLGPHCSLTNVQEALWAWTIGARRPCTRWLQDRVGHRLEHSQMREIERISRQIRVAMALESERNVAKGLR